MKPKKAYFKQHRRVLPAFGMLMALLIISGCSDDMFNKRAFDSRHISFQPQEAPRTKGVSLNSPQALADNGVSIFVNALQYTGPWIDLAARPAHYMTNTQLTSDASGMSWDYSPEKVWPVSDYLAFFASTPGATFVSGTTAPFYPSYAVSAGENDLLVSTPVYDRTHDNGPNGVPEVLLNMQHILAKVGFSVRLSSAPPNRDVIVKRIYLGGIEELYSKASYVYNNGNWEFTDLIDNYQDAVSFNTVEVALSYTPIDVCNPGGYYFFIPQEIDKVLTVDVDYAIVSSTDHSVEYSHGTLMVDFNPYEKNGNRHWETGEAYNYIVALDPVAGTLDVQPGFANSDITKTKVDVDAHAWRQPVYLSAPYGWAKVTIENASANSQPWVWFTDHIIGYNSADDVPLGNRYYPVGQDTYYVNFGNTPETTMTRTLVVHFEENTAYDSNEKFNDRNCEVVVKYFQEFNQTVADIQAGGLTPFEEKRVTCTQRKPFYIGRYSDYRPIQEGINQYAFYKGLIMENLEECDMEIYSSDRTDMLTFKRIPDSNPTNYYWGLRWSENPSFNYTADNFSDYEGKTNTRNITGIENDMLSFLPADRFGASAAKYCQKKGPGWFLPSPVQLARMMGATPNSVTGLEEYPWELEDGSYWTSAAASNTTAKSTTKLGDDRSSDLPFADIMHYKRVRCVKEVELSTVTPPAFGEDEDGNTTIDTGDDKLIITPLPPTGTEDSTQNHQLDKANGACVTKFGIGYRVPTLTEIIYLYEIKEFLPEKNRFGNTQFYFDNLTGSGKMGTIDFNTTPYTIYNEAGSGSLNYSVRCVKSVN